MGRIDIGANKTIGQSVRLVELDPKTFNAAEAMDKSIETAKTKYPTGEIMSTKMVVYDYPEIGAMTIVKDKIRGDEHRIFVDAYTLDVIPDQPATKTEPGVWSMYEKVVKNKIDENLKKWQNSDELVKSIEQAATDKGVNINVPVTEENIKKLRDNTTIASKTVQKTIISPANFGFAQKLLSVPVYSQATTYYCVPASAAMITTYYKGSSPSQSSIYQMMNGVAPHGVSASRALLYYKSSNGLNKPNSSSSFDVRYLADIRNEIDNNRPLQSNTATHARACVGYQYNGLLTSYLRLNDPWPIGHSYWEAFGSESDRIYVK
ncbi:C39 family peptidase [Methanosarcina spelaei]|nr:C39 family peptidase [Methanosarcina spelaei]